MRALRANDEGVIPYLEQVIELDPDNKYLKARLKKLQQPPAEEPESADEELSDAEKAAAAIPICGTS